MEEISSMAHDVLLRAFVNRRVIEGAAFPDDRSVEMRDEILRRMDSTARRVDVLPDGHRA